MPTHLTDLTVGSICKTTSYGPRQITLHRPPPASARCHALHLISALLVGGPTLHHITGPDGLPKRSEPQCKSSTYDVLSRTRTCVTLFRVTMGPCLRHPGYQATRGLASVCFLNNTIDTYCACMVPAVVLLPPFSIFPVSSRPSFDIPCSLFLSSLRSGTFHSHITFSLLLGSLPFTI